MMQEYIYALDQRMLDKIVPFDPLESAECFDLYRIGDINTNVASRGLCGVVKDYLSKFNFAAPLVPYAIVVRRIPGRSFDDANFEVALYKQTKGDRQVLSIGLSGSVYPVDLEGATRVVQQPTPGAIGGGPLTYYNFMDVIDNAGHRIVNDTMKYYLASGPFYHGLLGFMRDGVKKPGYEGAAHVCLPYLVEVRYDVVPKYFDSNLEFIGWFKPVQLMSIANLQQALAVDPSLDEHSIHFADLDLDEKIKGNAKVTMEPWTAKLSNDYHMETIIQEKLNPEIH